MLIAIAILAVLGIAAATFSRLQSDGIERDVTTPQSIESQSPDRQS